MGWNENLEGFRTEQKLTKCFAGLVSSTEGQSCELALERVTSNLALKVPESPRWEKRIEDESRRETQPSIVAVLSPSNNQYYISNHIGLHPWLFPPAVLGFPVFVFAVLYRDRAVSVTVVQNPSRPLSDG